MSKFGNVKMLNFSNSVCTSPCTWWCDVLGDGGGDSDAHRRLERPVIEQRRPHLLFSYLRLAKKHYTPIWINGLNVQIVK